MRYVSEELSKKGTPLAFRTCMTDGSAGTLDDTGKISTIEMVASMSRGKSDYNLTALYAACLVYEIWEDLMLAKHFRAPPFDTSHCRLMDLVRTYEFVQSRMKSEGPLAGDFSLDGLPLFSTVKAIHMFTETVQAFFKDCPFMHGTFPLELVPFNPEKDFKRDDWPAIYSPISATTALETMQLYRPASWHQALVKQSIDFVAENILPLLPESLYDDTDLNFSEADEIP
jgi:hypothetical protein